VYRILRIAAVAASLMTGIAAWNCIIAGEAKEEPKPSRTPDCVYVGTPNDVVAKMLDMAKIKKTDLVYDPGCGDGRMVITAAKTFGCRGVGYEIDPKLVAEARALAKKRKVDNLVKIEEQDIFKVDYSDGNVISMYLLPDMIVKLLPQLEKMKPGSRIVAHDYYIRDVKADETVTMKSNEDNVEHTLYLYTLPLKKEKKKIVE
jgi:cyclopropane fatty-acyl-phospholipid synthase-like methyltransferase